MQSLPPTSPSPEAGVHRRARINYRIRTGAFAYSFVVLAVHAYGRDYGPFFWALLGVQFLVYPQLAWLHARYANDSKRAEERNLYIDAFFLGAWVAGFEFPAWITYAALFSTAMNAIVVRGAAGALWSAGGFALGAAAWVALYGLQFGAPTGDLVTALCFAGSLAYTCWVAYVVYQQSGRLAGARDALRASEERYRLIAENAGDLIAMVDPKGHWLYTSPSYERVLERADLAPGADAFAKVHPDDAERARSAVVRAMIMGKPRDIALRLVDKEGRVRQYKTRVQALFGKEPRMLLVSQDVTDLRASEERVLLAAHALEGMTEAIVITSADGTIVTVNRAFCELTGFERDDVLGQSEKMIRNALQPPSYYDDVFETVLREGYWSGTTWARRKNGAVYREWRSVRAVRDEDGAVTHYVMVMSEVDGAQRPGAEITNPDVRG